MRQAFTLFYACVLAFLSTAIILLFAFEYKYELDQYQLMTIGSITFLGYAASALAFYIWYDNRQMDKKRNIQRF